MNQNLLLKIFLTLSLCAIAWMYFNPRVEVKYEHDQRILEINKRLQTDNNRLQNERDILARTRVVIKERIVNHYIKLKENEKVIPDLGVNQLDSVIRAGLK